MKETAAFFKVLADEARLRMLWLLFRQRELCVCDFIEVLGITQSKASRHLRILYGAGLVTDRREGLWVYYALRPLPNGLAKGQLDMLRSHLAGRPDAAVLLRRLSTWLRRKRGAKRCVEKPASKLAQTSNVAVPSGVLPAGRQS
ncbi:MAG: transcriptional regulator, ArsR family [Acidobacteria bacterium]|nr:transcriptional regulator, ArsR family [Acidobacteriota bacterium]